jgi:5-methylthioadenosine/S-adenosylhomocysteine deaminase
MATIKGAQALHMERDIGSLEAGKLADFVLIDAHELNLTSLYNVYSHLVYAAKAADVRTVVIGGRVVMRERQLLTLDEAAIKRRAVEFSESIRRSLDTPPQ